MAMPTSKSIKILSYNSTGFNSVKAQWIRDLMDTTGASMLGQQEHFKNTKSIHKLFKKEFPKCDSMVVPAYREEGRDSGRAKGGLAQIVDKSLNGVKRQRMQVQSWRIQAQILHFGAWRLLWVNCYFPCDPKVLNFNEAELLVVQGELEALLNQGGYDGCICGGDFNYDARRRSGFARSMATFLEKVGLISIWEKFPVDFTYMHTDSKSTSVLDNFFVNEAMLPYIERAGPLHLGDNGSGHSPIMMCLKVQDIPRRQLQQDEIRVPRRLAWDKAEKEELSKYKAELQRRLEQLEEPNCVHCKDVKCLNISHSSERDEYVLDVMSACVEASYACIPTAPPPKPSDQKQKKERLPGWKETCEPLCSKAKFWYAIWLSAGKPSAGELHRLMVVTRVKFRAAVRKAKKEADSARAHIFLQAAECGDQKLLREMQKVIGSKTQEQELPDSLEGASGHTEVVEKFRELYEALYTSAGTEGRMEELKLQMWNLIDCRSEAQVRLVTAGVVADACRRMKGGKIDVSESYASNIFCHAPPLLCQKLALVFRSFLTHGTLTKSILTCAFMPLLKSARKDPSKFDSWRAVAGASQLLKLFEYVLLEVWGSCLQSDSLQFGFKSNTGTDQCTWILHSVAEHYYLHGSSTVACLLDVKKGFPSVKFADLFQICLVDKKLPAVVCRVLAFMYEEQVGFIKCRGRRSANFRLINGLREGAACSPVLWAVYADGLLKELRKSGLGCYIAGKWVGAVMYADDLSLIAPTRAILARMLALVEAYGARLNLTFSSCQDPGKCKSFCLYFVGMKSPRKVVYPSPLVLNGVQLPWRESAIHLGHTLHQNLKFDADASVRRAAFIARSVEVRSQFSFAPPVQVLTAIKLLCCHAYGAMLWQLQSNPAASYFKAYSSCVRRVYGLPLNTFTYLVEGHLASHQPPLRNMVLARYPRFFQRLLTSASSEVTIVAGVVSKDARSTTAGNLAFLGSLTGLDVKEASRLEVRNKLPLKEVPEQEFWRLGLLDRLLVERSELLRKGADAKRVIAMISSLCAT